MEIFIFTLTPRKLEDVTVQARRKVHRLSKNSVDGLECGGWE